MNKNIICLLNINHNEYSVKSWSEYAKKINSELVIIDQLLFDITYMSTDWYLMYCLDILDANKIEYDQVLFVNNNMLVHPNAKNIFELTNNKLTGVRVYGDMEIVLSSIEIFGKLLNKSIFPYYTYLDTNMIILNKSHKQLLNSIQTFYEENFESLKEISKKYNLISSVPIFNFFFNSEIKDFTILGYEWNMQDMMRFEVLTNDLLHTKYGYISQYSNIPNPEMTMKYTYEHIYRK